MSEAVQPFIGKRALVHLAVFGVLLLLVLLLPEPSAKVGVRELKLPTLEKDRVVSIEIGGKQKAKLTKEPGGWMVQDPKEENAKKVPVEKDLIDRALTGIAELEAGAFVSGRKEKHDELELTEEKGTFVTISTDDKKVLSVVFGRFAKGGGTYFRKQDSDETFVAKGSLASAIKKDAAQWRKKKLLDVEEDALISVEVALPGAAPYTLVRGPAEASGDDEKSEPKPGPWKLADGTALPAGFRLDDAALGRVPRSFAGLRVIDYVDAPKDPAAAGLGEMAARVTAKSQDGKSFTLLFGGEDDKKRIYTQLEGEAQLYVINEYTRKSIAKPLDELRDMTFLPGLDASRVSEMRIEGAEGGNVRLTKSGGTWTIAEGTPPADKPFDPAGVESKIGQLARTKGQTLVGEGAAAGFRSSRPPLVITLVVDGEAAPRTVEFSEPVSGKDAKADGPANQVHVRVSDGFVYETGKFQRDRWAKPWEVFKVMEPPPDHGGGGGIPGMDSLPPDIRKQLEEQLKKGNFPGR